MMLELYDVEAKELKQVVLIWPKISPKNFTETKFMWLWKEAFLLFSTIYFFPQPASFELHANPCFHGFHRWQKRFPPRSWCPKSDFINADGHREPVSWASRQRKFQSFITYRFHGWQKWEACQGLCVHKVDLSTTISLLNLLPHREPVSGDWPLQSWMIHGFCGRQKSDDVKSCLPRSLCPKNGSVDDDTGPA